MNQNNRDYPHDNQRDFSHGQEASRGGSSASQMNEAPFQDIPENPQDPQAAPNNYYNYPAPDYEEYTGAYNPYPEVDPGVNSARRGQPPHAHQDSGYTAPQGAQRQADYYRQGAAYAQDSRRPEPRGGRPTGGRGPAMPDPNTALKHDFTKILGELSKLFKSFFSASPAKALNQDLSTPTWIGLLVVNILFFGLAVATYKSQSLGSLGNLASSLGLNVSAGWGASFGFALIQQAIVILLYFLAAWLFSGMSGETKLPPLQYLKIVSYPTLLHSLLNLAIIFISLFAPMAAASLLQFNKYLLFFSFAYFFNSIYTKQQRSRYWLFGILLLLISLIA